MNRVERNPESTAQPADAAPSEPRPPKVRIRGARKSYGAVVALAETDLNIREGEFLTLLGPSGSGKTTLLMMIAGLTAPDAGEIWIGGREATHAPPEKRDIGMVFQNYALFPHMTVYENIAFPLRMRRLDGAAIKREIDRVLEVVQLPQVADRMPSQLSGGQQQRIALARCIVYHPSIILMDEPLGALDKKLREQMQLEIKRLHRDLGITILYVTHDQEEAFVLSDRVCLMNNARIEQTGTPRQLYLKPATLFAAEFLGESNIFDASLRSGGPVRCELAGPGGMTLCACGAQGSISEGERVRAVVRPENIRVLQPGERADNELEGSVVDVVLIGQTTRHYARCAGGQIVMTAALTRSNDTVPGKGETIRLGWPMEATVLISHQGVRV